MHMWVIMPAMTSSLAPRPGFSNTTWNTWRSASLSAAMICSGWVDWLAMKTRSSRETHWPSSWLEFKPLA